MLDEILAFWRELLSLNHDRLKLAGLETQRAGLSLVIMLITAIALAFILNFIGLLLSYLVILQLIAYGMAIHQAILLVIALNLLFVLILVYVIRHNSRNLLYPALLRSLKPAVLPVPKT